MLLYLVQHAECKPEEEDPERSLTDNGFFHIRKTAHFMAGIRMKRPAQILHSGKKRAEQTAFVIKDTLHPPKGISAVKGLDPDDDPHAIMERLQKETAPLLLVGHLPNLKRLASLLLAGDGNKDLIDFKNAGVVCLKRDEGGQWSVEWAVTPDLLK